jgi:hypothetical protein
MPARVAIALVLSTALLIGAPAGATRPSRSVDPKDFVSRVDNRFFPLRPGTKLRYEGVAEDGKTPQTDIVYVTSRHKRILGVSCTVVRDTVSSQGRPVERTYDWYAQDRRGNVWYFGEDSRGYRNGRFVKAGDSWKAGFDGARAGLIMEANPKTGDTYRQEYYRGHAEDRAEVLGSRGPVDTPFRSFDRTLQTVERTRLEPGAAERKYYAAGIGEVKSQVVSGDHEAFALVDMSR